MAGGQVRHAGEGAAAADEMVARHDPGFGAVEVVEREADLDEDGAAAARGGGGAGEGAQRCADALGPGEDRDQRRQGLDAVRRVAEQEVALEGRLGDEAEFAGLEVFQAAVDQP